MRLWDSVCVALMTLLMLVEAENGEQQPSVMIALLVRNKAHALPNVLGALQQQDYPSERISWWIREDHSMDDSADVLENWVANDRDRPSYHSVDIQVDRTLRNYSDEEGPLVWGAARFQQVMKLRQEALLAARSKWADRVLMLDADVVLTNRSALANLVRKSAERSVLAPLLNCTTDPDNYANFWGAMDENGFYKRSDNYFPVKRRELMGIFEVPMVHTALMINLRRTDSLLLDFSPPAADYSGAYDDIIVFAVRAREAGVQLHVDNTVFYGYFPLPLTHAEDDLEHEVERFRHLRMETMLEKVDLSLEAGAVEDQEEIPVEGPPVAPALSKWVEPPTPRTHGFDKIYLINLARRRDRRKKMDFCFRELGIQAHYWQAVDGRNLNVSYLSSLKVRQMPGYADPYHGRGLTLGEVGCFLSHLSIWEELLADPKLERVLIFEDDIRFDGRFVSHLENAVIELDLLKPDWELFYLGRKIMLLNETMLDQSLYVAQPEYTYWTLSYAITKKGAQKLLAQEPLKKMVAVDEFLPIMFNRHPREDWKQHFGPRDLKAYTVAPLLVQPTHYVGEKHYFSDTEKSVWLCQGKNSKGDAIGISLGLCGEENLSVKAASSAKTEL